MKCGLSLNVNETLQSIVEKSIASETCGLDYLWIADLPDQLYAPVVASKVASRTRRIRIGVGLMSVFLHAPRHLAMAMDALCNAYGDRFDMCIGVGDVQQLKHVGVHVEAIRNLPSRVLESKRKISSYLRKRGVDAQIWLGAQGPKMLGIAKRFDGVLLNYSKPTMIEWAIAEGHLMRKHGVKIGVYPPSYVYVKLRPDMLPLAKISSSVVALGAPRAVLQRFGLYEGLCRAKELVEAGSSIDAIVNLVPDSVLEDFSATMQATDLPGYVDSLGRLGVTHVVFAYPQNYSVDTIRELKEALDLASRPPH